MKSKLKPFNEKLWQQAVRDADKALTGKPSSYARVTLPVPASQGEVKAARKAISATQRDFAVVVGVSLETVKAWEGGTRIPEGPATKLIRLLLKRPKFAFEALAA